MLTKIFVTSFCQGRGKLEKHESFLDVDFFGQLWMFLIVFGRRWKAGSEDETVRARLDRVRELEREVEDSLSRGQGARVGGCAREGGALRWTRRAHRGVDAEIGSCGARTNALKI